VRIIAATNRDLQEEVAQKRFREDLFYRLNVFPIQLPPLRERLDTIPLLAGYFLQRFSSQVGKKIKTIEPDAMTALQGHSWPGNIRELQNVMERAVILAQDVVRRVNLPDSLTSRREPGTGDSKERLKQVERELIVEALQRRGGNRRLAADDLQMSRRSLQYKLKELGLLDGE
jgi:transcriptional regulator with PAS, ATPase and Fis domain